MLDILVSQNVVFQIFLRTFVASFTMQPQTLLHFYNNYLINTPTT